MSAIHIHDCRRLIEVDGIYLDTLPVQGIPSVLMVSDRSIIPAPAKKTPEISHPPHRLCGHTNGQQSSRDHRNSPPNRPPRRWRATAGV